MIAARSAGIDPLSAAEFTARPVEQMQLVRKCHLEASRCLPRAVRAGRLSVVVRHKGLNQPARTDGVQGYRDITPRMGAAYDVFGNGKTALKVNAGQYLQGAWTGDAYTISNPGQLAGLPWADAETGSGFRLERLVYQELYVRDRAVVILFPLGLRTDHMTDADLTAAVRTEPTRFREVVLMPPESERGVGEIDEACRERVAPGEAVP